MNGFSFRPARDGVRYNAEFKLAHWAGFKMVLDDHGRPQVFPNPGEASLAAAAELVKALNRNPEFWRGPENGSARAAAEKLFAGKQHGE